MNASEFSYNLLKDVSYGFVWDHTKIVVEMAKQLSKKIDENIDQEALEIGCWLHDIGRAKPDENHNDAGIKLANHLIANLNEPQKKIVIDIIKNHGRKGNPETPEGLIAKSADKMSAFTENAIMWKMLKWSREYETVEEIITHGIENLEKKYNLIIHSQGKEIIQEQYEHYKKFLTSFGKK